MQETFTRKDKRKLKNKDKQLLIIKASKEKAIHHKPSKF